MKGFVPVTKESLLAMLAGCREEVDYQFTEHSRERIERFIDNEKERCSKRRLFGLINPPRPRFDYNEEGVKAYAATIHYDMFDGNPFDSIEKDRDNSLRWIARLERVAMSEHSGEPIQIDMDTFMLISEPVQYYWATTGNFYSRPYQG